MNLSGKLVVVTGASSGIGEAAARAFVKAGCRVALLARSRDKLAALAADLGPSAKAYAADLTKAGEVAEAAARIEGDLGVPDVVVNNAGAGRFLFLEETEPSEAVEMMASPYFAAFFTTRAFLPKMLERGSGVVVTVNSPSALVAFSGMTGYTAARWALRGLHEALKNDLRGTGLRALHFVPGKVSSPYFSNNPGSEQRIPKISRLTPTLTPEQAAAALLRGLEREKSQVIVPFMALLLYWLHWVCPGPVEWAVAQTAYRRR